MWSKSLGITGPYSFSLNSLVIKLLTEFSSESIAKYSVFSRSQTVFVTQDIFPLL